MGGARVMLCTAPNSKAIGELIPGLSRSGEIIIVTGASEPTQYSPALLLGGSRTIRGSIAGSIDEALRFTMLSGIRPMIETFSLEQAPLAFERMMTAKVHFRAVLTIDGA